MLSAIEAVLAYLLFSCSWPPNREPGPFRCPDPRGSSHAQLMSVRGTFCTSFLLYLLTTAMVVWWAVH